MITTKILFKIKEKTLNQTIPVIINVGLSFQGWFSSINRGAGKEHTLLNFRILGAPVIPLKYFKFVMICFNALIITKVK